MALVIRCANCSKDYEFPKKKISRDFVSCPHCSTSTAADNVSCVMFCPHCYEELLVPMSVIKSELQCPYCDKTFHANVSFSLDDDDHDEDEILHTEDSKQEASFAENDIFDKYKIIKLLGKGGMGEVYLVQHMLLNNTLALKIMNGEAFVNNPVYAKRFIREAKLANKIQSKNFVAVHDVGMESKSGSLFIAMEYVNGKNLSEIMAAKGTFNEADILKIASDVAGVLIILEREKIVHRDIKPSNIMIDEDGTVKLADLGIAKSENKDEQDLTLTQGNLVFGTPNYASPEQCRSSHNVDYRTDIYSLGATMFHMAAGCPPYEGSTAMDVILNVLNGEPKDLQKLAPSMSAGFIMLINDMLKQDPEQRPPNAEALKMRIDSLLAGRQNLLAFIKVKWKIIKSQTSYIASQLFYFTKKLYQSIPRQALIRIFKVAFSIVFALCCFFAGLKYRHKLLAGWNYLKKEFISGMNQKAPESAIPADETTPAPAAVTAKTAPDDNYSAITEPAETTKTNVIKKSPANKKTITKNTAIIRDEVSLAISQRLDKCINDLNFLENDAANYTDRIWYMERIKFFRTLRNTLTRQLKNSREAFALKQTNNFDSKNSSQIIETIAKYSERDENEPFGRRERVFAKQLLHYLKAKHSNPNLNIVDSRHPEFSGPILRWLLHARIPYKNDIQKILLEHHASTDCINGDCNIELCKYGIRNLDGMIFRKIHSKKYQDAITLINYGANVNETDPAGRTPIFYAIQHNQYDVVRQLLIAGADPNAVASTDFQTPLFYACKYASENIIGLLKKTGADDSCTDIRNLKAENYTYVNEFNRIFKNADISKISSMLDKYPDLATLEMCDGITPLQQAVKNNNIAIVKKLLSMQINPDQCGSANPYTPLQTAYRNSNSKHLNLRSRSTAANIMIELLQNKASGKVKPIDGNYPTLLQDIMSSFRTFNDAHLQFIQALIRNYDISSELTPILLNMYEHKHLYYGNDKFSESRSQAFDLLMNSKPDFSSAEFNSLFPAIAWSPKITEAAINKLIACKININGTTPDGQNALSYLVNYAFKNSIHLDSSAMEAISSRIKFLRSKGVKVNATLKNLDLPPSILKALQ